MRIWAGDEVRIDEKELEGEAMEGIETADQRIDGDNVPSASTA